MSYAQAMISQLANRMALQATKSTTSKIASMRNDGSPFLLRSQLQLCGPQTYGFESFILAKQDEEAFMGFRGKLQTIFMCRIFSRLNFKRNRA